MQSQVQVVSCASRGSTIVQRFQRPLLGSISLLTELRETFYLLEYQCIIKGCHSGTARWKTCIGQGMGKGHAFPKGISPNLHVFTNLEAVRTPAFSFFSRRLHYRDMINSLHIGDGFNLQILSPSGKLGVPIKSANALITTWGPLESSPQPLSTWVLSKGHLINITKPIYHSHHLGNSSGFRH